jgi:hypothetical protein
MSTIWVHALQSLCHQTVYYALQLLGHQTVYYALTENILDICTACILYIESADEVVCTYTASLCIPHTLYK